MKTTPETIRDEVKAEMRTGRQVYRGVRFPRRLFVSTASRKRTAVFDAAYDLACQRLGLQRVEVIEDGEHLRFLPSLTGG